MPDETLVFDSLTDATPTRASLLVVVSVVAVVFFLGYLAGVSNAQPK